jgi:hypothetical protein
MGCRWDRTGRHSSSSSSSSSLGSRGGIASPMMVTRLQSTNQVEAGASQAAASSRPEPFVSGSSHRAPLHSDRDVAQGPLRAGWCCAIQDFKRLNNQSSVIAWQNESGNAKKTADRLGESLRKAMVDTTAVASRSFRQCGVCAHTSQETSHAEGQPGQKGGRSPLLGKIGGPEVLRSSGNILPTQEFVEGSRAGIVAGFRILRLSLILVASAQFHRRFGYATSGRISSFQENRRHIGTQFQYRSRTAAISQCCMPAASGKTWSLLQSTVAPAFSSSCAIHFSAISESRDSFSG